MCTMKCPSCGGTASKDKPEDQFKCESCAWRLEQAHDSNELADLALQFE